MTTTEEFEIQDVATVKKLTSTARAKEIDPTWAGRIRPLGIGQGFKTSRPDTETVRQFKARINRSAESVFRSLTWTTLDPKQPEGVEPSKFLAKVQAIDTKGQEEAAAKAAAAETAPTAPTANGTAETPTDTSAETPRAPRPPR